MGIFFQLRRMEILLELCLRSVAIQRQGAKTFEGAGRFGMALAFLCLLKQWDVLNLYSNNGWVGIDNNIAENALRCVAAGRKNWLFAGSYSGGVNASMLY